MLQREGREIRWALCFEADLEKLYTTELRTRGHHPPPGTPVSELGRIYRQLVRARLEHLQGERLLVRYSREMKARPPLPAIAEIARRARRGEPLWPYLSKETRKASFNDGLLNHWGIVHFHLGEEFENTGWVKRTGEHLYAWIAEQQIYFLDVRNHALADDRLLNVIVRNWPKLLDPFKLRDTGATTSAQLPEIVKDGRMKRFTRSVLVHRAPRMSPGETTALRDAGVSPTFVAETGVHYSPPGGGASCAGTGTYAMVLADYEVLWAMEVATAVITEIDQLVGHIERERGIDFDTLEFHLESLEALRAAIVLETSTKVRFTFKLPMEFNYDLDPAMVLAPIAAAATAPIGRSRR